MTLTDWRRILGAQVNLVTFDNTENTYTMSAAFTIVLSQGEPSISIN